ncbi:MBOAT family O-acyltransferase [Desulfobacter sp. UBA2225]|uniref:MBOAT family O-acyltransferase n=1 Tax=Desulfobacter sp. UBA2225 TaxID=1961413 RepID=UPI00257B7F3C|nr:MBOAT family O-acyltransferase [Desulfobacter sp. UBA2225]
MIFNSLVFFVFLAVVLCAYYCLTQRYQNYLLVIASYVFYGYWDWRFLFLIFISTIVDYYCGYGIHTAVSLRNKKLYLWVSVCVNIGILLFFKYFNFFIDSAQVLLSRFGFNQSLPVMNIILPVGVSFYTFQTLSYTLDIYRGKMKPTTDFLTFVLYVTYFPQLVAGPIERARMLLPQLSSSRTVGWPQIGIGMELILIGFFKKVGISDMLAPMVDLRFQYTQYASWSDLILAVYLFSIQIYCDFSGYSDIARGVSKLFGIEIMRNFEQPYLSQSITEFWRRWHISLSSWFRDYVYIPLGGNREGVFKTYRNLMATMLVCGLWHGANWTFVLWGGYHGLFLMIQRVISQTRKNYQKKRDEFGCKQLIKIFFTFHLVAFGWIMFRCDSFSHFLIYVNGIISLQEGNKALTSVSWLSPKLWSLCIILFLMDLQQYRTGRHAILLYQNWGLRGVAYAGIISIIFLLGGIDVKVPFIYFQF